MNEMRIIRFLLSTLVILFLQANVSGQDYKFLKDPAGLNGISAVNGIENPVTIRVVKCGATHCTGVKQTEMIKEAFGNNFIELGAGNTIVLN